ncbi:MAG: Gldg family protein [Deltaproteobacteria bacterium]|nr:Gldg family protein [Deltaproteobacteria bacterium]
MPTGKGFDYKRTLISVTGLAVLFLVLILVNIIVSYAAIRWDVTEDDIYSLSEGTRHILSDLKQPVAIKFFYSKSNPDIPANIKVYAKHVEDFLSEYRRQGKGRITVEMIDPKPDSDEEEWAQRYGVEPMRTGGARIYCGLVFLAADQEDVIPWLDPAQEQMLEYDITRIIQGLQTTEKKVVGIISSLPIFGTKGRVMPGQAPGEEWLFIREMKKTYDIKEISPLAQKIDMPLDLLMVVYPKHISPRLEYAIDQYVLSGGNALIFVDPLCISDREQGQQSFLRSSGDSLKRVFKAWGIAMDPAKAVVDFGQPTRVRTGNRGAEDNPLMVSARGNSFNREDVVTAGLETMLFPVAGAIEKLEDADSEFEPLASSSTNAGLTEAFNAYLGLEAIKRKFAPAGQPFHMAVRIRGTFKTAFPEGCPESEDAGDKPEGTPQGPHLAKGKGKATVIVVSDADMLADQFYVHRGNFFGLSVSQMFNDNLTFLSNAAEILTGSDDLIGLRSRGKLERPFTVVLELKKKAQERWLSKEKELVRRIEETNRKLRQLEAQKDGSQKMILSSEQEAEIARFREERQKINRELKNVRKNLRADIERLGATLKALNIFLVPSLVCVAGVLFAIYRQRKVKRK